MFKHLNRKKGQSTLEYAVLIIIIIAALLAMNQYISRGLRGKLKSSTDDIGDQFSPGNTNVTRVVTSYSNSLEQYGVEAVGVQRSQLLQRETTNTTENVDIVNTTFEFMGNG